MIEAANGYYEKMGASLESHQIAVFQHHDRPHKHIHVYINRPPVGGGKALVTSHNYARNMRVCKEICQGIGFSLIDKVPAHSLRFVRKAKQEVHQKVHLAIKHALKRNCKTHEQFIEMLKSMGVQSKFNLVDGRLKYSSYNCCGVNFKGQDVGFSAKRLQLILDKSKPRARLSRTGSKDIYNKYVNFKLQN